MLIDILAQGKKTKETFMYISVHTGILELNIVLPRRIFPLTWLYLHHFSLFIKPHSIGRLQIKEIQF